MSRHRKCYLYIRIVLSPDGLRNLKQSNGTCHPRNLEADWTTGVAAERVFFSRTLEEMYVIYKAAQKKLQAYVTIYRH